jgi:glycine/D-amino acid oxidase-like deaminating enzyme
MAADVAVIGGGILGLATAAFLAEAGAGVRLYEREELACGASGRNSGVLQHPLDEELAPIYEESLALYAALDGFPFPEEAAGMLVLSEDPVALAAEHAALDARFPELRLTRLDAAEVAAAEPGLAPGLLAYRLDEARPVPPAAAAAAFAARARRAGAHIEEGTPATPALEGTRVAGVRTSGGLEPAGAVVVAAGPWSAEVLPAGLAPPVAPLWGVVSEVALDAPPRHVLEEAGVEELSAAGESGPRLFSLVTAAGRSSVGSSFERKRPDPAAVGPELAARAARFAPVLREAPRASVRACARPQSADGRPFLGPVPGVDGLHLATGHGPWGVTLAPGSARRVAAGVLGAADAIPPALSPARAGPWSDPRP